MPNSTSRTIFSNDGRILFFGLQDFLDSIVIGNNCFICGAAPSSTPFNNEHVIPDWLLRKFNLYKNTINLPNETQIRYSQYTVPCCSSCNSKLGLVYEEPISRLLNSSSDIVASRLSQDKDLVNLVFKWMSLIFFKTHLKDNSLLAERDRRLQSGFIGDIYNWQEFHHTHCIIRSHYTKAVIEPDVYGTLLLFPALTIEGRTGFDYFDNHASQSVMLQCGDFYLVTILNDSSMSYEIFKEDLHRINGPITPFQAREILAHLGFINLSLADRPKYISKFSPKNEYRITANLPSKITLKAPSESDLTPGKFLHYSVKNMIDVENKDQILQEILEGKRNYLFNEEGKFINHENNSY